MVIDESRLQVRKGKRRYSVTLAQCAILQALMKTDGALTRDQLLTAIGGIGYNVSPRTIDMHIVALRKKLGRKIIETIRGVGYALKEGIE